MIRLATRIDLAKMIPAGGIGAELGVFQGWYSRVLLEHAKPAKMFLVDHWIDTPAYIGQVPCAIALEQVRATFTAPEVEIVQQDTISWLESQADNTLDWIYLDSDHDYKHISKEILWAFTKVKPGGLLMGHDYCCVLPWVVFAVDEFCRNYGQEIHYLTHEKKELLDPRLPWQPKKCAFNSYAIVVRK